MKGLRVKLCSAGMFSWIVSVKSLRFDIILSVGLRERSGLRVDSH